MPDLLQNLGNIFNTACITQARQWITRKFPIKSIISKIIFQFHKIGDKMMFINCVFVHLVIEIRWFWFKLVVLIKTTVDSLWKQTAIQIEKNDSAWYSNYLSHNMVNIRRRTIIKHRFRFGTRSSVNNAMIDDKCVYCASKCVQIAFFTKIIGGVEIIFTNVEKKRKLQFRRNKSAAKYDEPRKTHARL